MKINIFRLTGSLVWRIAIEAENTSLYLNKK